MGSFPLLPADRIPQYFVGCATKGSLRVRKVQFLDALASLNFKLSVSQWVSHAPFSSILQLAHLRVFQIIWSGANFRCFAVILGI